MKPRNLFNSSLRLQGAMKYTACTLVTGSWLLAGTALAAPANDDFANAIDLQLSSPGAQNGVQTGTNTTDGTFQVGEPAALGSVKTVWFKWTCPADGKFTLKTDGSMDALMGEWDAVLGAFSGNALNALTPLSGTYMTGGDPPAPTTSPNNNGIAENLTIIATEGVTYYFQLAGYIGSGGVDTPSDNIMLTWDLVPTVYEAQIATFGPDGVIDVVSANAANIAQTVPYGTNLATYAPTFTLSPGATCDKTSGAVPTPTNFSGGPVVYKVTSKGATPIVNNYTATVSIAEGFDWNLATGGEWDFSTSNWLKQPSAVVSTFTDGSGVVFNKPEGGIINIPAAVSPGATLVSAASGTYTFSGPGALAGTGSLTKSGAGILKLTGSNAYTGNTTVEGGTLEAAGTGALGYSSKFSVATGSTLALTIPVEGLTHVWPQNLVAPAAGPNFGTLTGGGNVTIDLGYSGSTFLNFDMSAFTGEVTFSRGQATIIPYYSPGFKSPVTGTLNVGNGATLYLGWLAASTYTANIKLSEPLGSYELIGALRGDNATLNGTITLMTDTTIGSIGVNDKFIINSVIGDGGNNKGFTTVRSGTIILNATTNTYTGPTIVDVYSKLQCNTPGALGSGPLNIKGKLNLNYVGTRTVASLTIAGVLKTAPGTYGSGASGAAFPDGNAFIGTGTVTVGGAVVNDYATWLAVYPSITSPADKLPTADPDGDGMTNQKEYAFGLNPASSSSVNPITQQLNKATGNFQYTRRATPAATLLTYVVQSSNDLVTWTPATSTETFTTASGVETVTVNVTTPAANGKLFVRVEAKPAP
jgi:autotransporter-associated beta strand protein